METALRELHREVSEVMRCDLHRVKAVRTPSRHTPPSRPSRRLEQRTETLMKPRLPIVFSIVSACAALHSPKPPVLDRRGALTAAAAALVASVPKGAQASSSGSLSEPVATPDYAAKSSFFGLAAPPVQGMWSYEQLLAEARAGTIASVQIAVQHDCVVATTTQGHRFSCLLPDERFPDLLADAMSADGSMPFEVLPMDEMREQIRSAALFNLNLLGLLWVADMAGVLPWDTTPYGSLAEREKAQAEPKPKRKPAQPAQLLAALRTLAANLGAKSPTAARPAARPAVRPAAEEAITHEEALQRVLGLTTWDAAAERKHGPAPRMEAEHGPAPRLETKHGQAPRMETELAKMQARSELLRPRQLEQSIIEASAAPLSPSRRLSHPHPRASSAAPLSPSPSRRLSPWDSAAWASSPPRSP